MTLGGILEPVSTCSKLLEVLREPFLPFFLSPPTLFRDELEVRRLGGALEVVVEVAMVAGGGVLSAEREAVEPLTGWSSSELISVPEKTKCGEKAQKCSKPKKGSG